jgi:hypothetical protein
MQEKSAATLQQRAKSVLGEQEFSKTAAMSILELHRAYSKAIQSFDEGTANAYKDLIVARTLTSTA